MADACSACCPCAIEVGFAVVGFRVGIGVAGIGYFDNGGNKEVISNKRHVRWRDIVMKEKGD